MDDVAHDLPDLYSEHLPASVRIADHPADNEYVIGIEAIKTEILVHSRTMTPMHVRIIKMVHQGKKAPEIAEAVELTAQSVHRVKNSTSGKQLLALLAYLNHAIDGAREDQRRHVLWSIVQRNHVKDPRVAITAIAELNRMAHQDRTVAAGLGGQTLEIIVNNNIPRGALDV